jgi:hypothetical protein
MSNNRFEPIKLRGALGRLPRVPVSSEAAANEREAQTADLVFGVNSSRLITKAFDMHRPKQKG